jgi:hypothetical protein
LATTEKSSLIKTPQPNTKTEWDYKKAAFTTFLFAHQLF